MFTKYKKQIIRLMGILLTIVMIGGCFSGILKSDRKEPKNPITVRAEELKAEVLDGKAALDLEEETNEGSDQSEESEEDSQSEKKEEEKEEEEEEKDEEEEQEEDPDKEPEEKPEKKPEKKPDDGAPESDENKKDETPDGDPEDTDGETPDDEGETPDDNSDTGDDDGADTGGLVTDLSSKIITFEELKNDMLYFYAYYSDVTVDSNIKVSYRHGSEEGNGRWLTAQGRDYSVKLSFGRNIIVIYYTDKAGKRNYASFTITYEANKADEENPEQGAHPPTITTNLDNWEGDIKTQTFTFTVKARTWENKQIYSDHITVLMDGQRITNPTGTNTYEYVLYFKKPNKGDTSKHKITVLAWDDDGNSKLVKFEVIYRSIEEGDVIGQVRVVVDATTVNKGIIADETVDIVQGRPASYTLLEALDTMNFEYDYAGTKDDGFYLRSIRRGNAFRNARMPETLRELIERDGLEFRDACTKNQLGEFDFTQGSGWMYCVNSGAYSGKGLSEWFLNDGDTIYLRFTLAYGKDIGVENSGFGRLDSYCGLWINDGFVALDHDDKVERKEPTETKDGYIKKTCKKCEREELEVLPATGTETPEDTTTQTPPEDTTTQAPPEDTTTQAPPEDTTTQAPPEDTTTQAPPEDTTTQAPPEDTPTQAPPEDTTTQTPPEDAAPQALPEDTFKKEGEEIDE